MKKIQRWRCKVTKVTAICYLSSLLFYGMGYSKMLVLNIAEVNTYDYIIYVSFATAYFVLTIFLAVIGSLFFYVKTIKIKKPLKLLTSNIELKRVGDRIIEDEPALLI